MTILLAFDGVVHVSDLPVQAFARHATDQFSEPAADQTRALIGGMRGFLEGRNDLLPADPAFRHVLSEAEDGNQAVEILCRAVGLTPRQTMLARRASRTDLANSAWAIDAAPGLTELLAGIPTRVHVAVVAHDLTGVAEVLDSIGIAADVDEVLSDPGGSQGIEQAITHVLDAVGAASTPGRLLVVGGRWNPDLAVAHAAGCVTALVDRFGLGRGTPTWRHAELSGLVTEILRWATTPGAVRA